MIIKPTILAEDDNDPALECLKSVGVVQRSFKGSDKNQLADILNNKGVSLENLIQELANLTESPDPTIRLRAVEKGFALHGVGKEEHSAPIINIMVVPREMNVQVADIPKILLPRQIDVEYETVEIENSVSGD